MLKVFLIRGYRRFRSKIPFFGLTMLSLSLGLMVTLAGCYFAVSAETESTPQKSSPGATVGEHDGLNAAKVKNGKSLFYKWCIGCHHPYTAMPKVGPGLKGILKREKLPMSGREAIPDNIRQQIRSPYKLMPLLKLTDQEIEYLIEFLKTL